MSSTAAVVNIPPAARRAAREANRIHREVYGAQSEEAAKPVEPESEPEPEAPKAEVATPATAPQAEQPPAPPVEAAPPAEKPAEPQDDWKARYNSLKGKYNKEMVPLQSQLRQQAEQIEALQQVIASMESAKPAAAPATQPQSHFITDSDVEDYGEETIDLVRRAAREEYNRNVEALNRRIAELENQLVGTVKAVQKTEREKLFEALDGRIANWREVNRDEGFLNWLAEPDPYSGMVRHALLKKAFEENNAARVLRFFEGYLGEHAVISEQPPAQSDERSSPQVDLETLVAPGRPREGSDFRAQEGKRIWTQREIKQFYRDVQEKRFAGRDKERMRIERDIIAASREGRVTA